jgi:hypothetical protein
MVWPKSLSTSGGRWSCVGTDVDDKTHSKYAIKADDLIRLGRQYARYTL